MDEALNGDLTKPTAARAIDMDWSSSPSGTVWRKRFHRVGPAESGQVTSVVRYEPDSTFPSHDHPEGEEILVLDGVFSDEHGDWPAGTYLLNPEGFRHAPFSNPGCLLFVKLRQFPGLDREHHVIDTTQRAWTASEEAGVQLMPLYRQSGFTDEMRLERWEAGSSPAERHYEDGAEVFVVEGSFRDGDGEYPQHSWLRLPPGATHNPRTEDGCTLYIKTGGFTYLRAD